jgi:hypothetical protein
LPDEWRDVYLKKLESENADVRHSSDLFVQNLKNDISAVSARLSRLTDAYLNEALELGEYLERKNTLTAEKKSLAETSVRAARFARGEVNSSSNSLWWSYLDGIRTFFTKTSLPLAVMP